MNLETLLPIAEWITSVHERSLELSGILYLHRISDNRASGTPRNNLKSFQKCYGDNFYERVFLTTTMWSLRGGSNEDMYQRRQTQLEARGWADMIAEGARTQQFRGSQGSALSILDEVIHAAVARRRQKVSDVQERIVHSMPGALGQFPLNEEFEMVYLEQCQDVEWGGDYPGSGNMSPLARARRLLAFLQGECATQDLPCFILLKLCRLGVGKKTSTGVRKATQRFWTLRSRERMG
ncbi:hypothetical protein AN958_02173 [Leucoagaricus sp. SymC.cos]|nr:hypothetical protein AN958_02173 [Leucoagaricus sp. SymC.cos]